MTTQNPTMTARDFSSWVMHMNAFGWTQKDCADALGVQPAQIGRWKRRASPRYIAIACLAIAEVAEAGGKKGQSARGWGGSAE